MAQVVFHFSQKVVDAPILVADASSEEITTSATSQATTATAANGGVCHVVNNGAEDVWVTFGFSPTAAVGTTFFIPADTQLQVGDMTAGHVAAVINDS